MSHEHDSSPQGPDIAQLMLRSRLARVRRLVSQGMDLEKAVAFVDRAETPEEYTARNAAAMQALEERMLSADYLERFDAIGKETDPEKRARMNLDLKIENFEAIDMEAVHRTIASRNRQMKAEGLLPPYTPT